MDSSFVKIIWAFLSLLFLLYIIVLGNVAVQPTGFTWGLSTIGFPVVELAFFGIATQTAWNLRASPLGSASLLVAIFVLSLAGAAYLIQLISIVMSGSYISVLAIQNVSEVAYVTNATTVSLTVGMVGILLIAFLSGAREVRKTLPSGDGLKMAAIGTVLITLMTITYIQRDKAVLQAQNLGVPISANLFLPPAIRILETYGKLSMLQNNKERVASFVDDVSIGKAESEYIFDVTSEFPFQHVGISLGPLPFSVAPPEQPVNVIILFLEGISARVLGHYDGPYADLTPNLNEFAANSLTVDNYYNHTAATYRGIQGGLASGFPRAGGAGGWSSSIESVDRLRAISYATLPTILKQAGYSTGFFSPHSKAGAFDKFLETIGFDTVVSLEDVSANSYSEPFLRDRELFQALTDALQEREETQNQTPFLWAVYNVGSHAFHDSPDDGLKYADGNNSALNRFYELDASLRPFLDAFEASSFAQNTLLVITADHSSYAEPPVAAAFSASPKFSPHFIDQIPLIIRVPGLKAPLRYQNGIRTSFDLTPTILNLMGISDVEHAFLGRSIFDPEYTPQVNWGVIGSEFYRIDQNGVSFVEEHMASERDVAIQNAVMFY
jgi:lipoteichoic acid synthase